MLETVRQFALEQLAESGEAAAVRTAHARWCLELAEASSAAHRARSGHAQLLARLKAEHANLRAALAWLLDAGETELSLQLAGALSGYWYYSGHFSEGRSWATEALARHPGGPPTVRARALQTAGILAHYQGEDAQAVPLLEAGLPLWREADDRWGTAFSFFLLGVAAEDRGDYDRAWPFFEEAVALFKALPQPIWEANSRCHLGIVALGRGDLDQAAALVEHAREQCRPEGDAWGDAMGLSVLGLVALEAGDLPRTAACFAERLPVMRDLRSPDALLRCLTEAATLAAAAGRSHQAARLFGAIAAMAEAAGLVFDLPERAIYERGMAAARGRLGEAGYAAASTAGRELSRDDAFAEALAVLTAPLTGPRVSLTPRETDVLRLLATESSVSDIAGTLFLSVRTVETHVAHIFAKLGVRSRAEAVDAARGAEPIEGGKSAGNDGADRSPLADRRT
jgi:non-specific serine/threonine protein kinase